MKWQGYITEAKQYYNNTTKLDLYQCVDQLACMYAVQMNGSLAYV